MSARREDEQVELDKFLALMPFATTVGIVLDGADPTAVRGHLDWAPERCTAARLLHGGALMTLADCLGAACAYLNLPPGAQTSTVSSSTVFLRGVRGGRVSGCASPLHAGRNVIVVRTDLLDDSEQLVAQVTQSQAVLAARPPSS